MIITAEAPPRDSRRRYFVISVSLKSTSAGQPIAEPTTMPRFSAS
jgi:hypothetical protein